MKETSACWEMGEFLFSLKLSVEVEILRSVDLRKGSSHEDQVEEV